MLTIKVASTLEYTVETTTCFIFSVAVGENAHQHILTESLVLSPNLAFEWLQLGEENIRSIRLQVPPGSFRLEYQAQVQMNPDAAPVTKLDEVSHQTLPVEVLPYLNPSHYCESDRLWLFASKTFGAYDTAYALVEGICDWVNGHVDYVSGSTNASSTACDVLVQCSGVCRDFAHVSIALCRALGIPARYVSGYALNLQPPDFHGFFEAFLDGKWYLFDATRMVPVSGLVRIGAGRDAADASFATIVGAASLQYMEVSALDVTSA